MTIDQEIVGKQLTLLQGYKEQLEQLREKATFEKFKDDFILRGSAERLLQLAIECCLNVGNHIISRKGFERPEDYAGVAKVLGQEGVISKDFAEEMVKMAKFRNRLVHLYWKVESKEVYEILQNKLGDFQKFAQAIVEYLEKG